MRFGLLLATALLLSACGKSDTGGGEASTIDTIAERYVKLALAMTPHDPAYVDAYFGPDAWIDEVRESPQSLEAIIASAEAMMREVNALSPEEADPIRAKGLAKRLTALVGRARLVSGLALDFDTEARLLYDTVPPQVPIDHFRTIHEEIDALLPGEGPLAERVETFRSRFVIPRDKLAEVFDAAIAECRSRTLAHMDLPDDERFTLEYVNDKPWSGYNWYQGDAESLIQMNTDLPIFIHRAVDLGCHEGYPGHHTYNSLLEANLVEKRNWIEFALYPLFSPQSLIAEGTANYGIKLAFPAEERIAFEKGTLFPLAGLDPSQADRYYELLALLEGLDYVDNEVARLYLGEDMDRETAADWLVEYKLMSPERAAQRVDFIDTYRSYVINYNHGRDMVVAYINAVAGDDPDARWEAFTYLLSNPLTPSDLTRATAGATD
ncbi:MAG: hypothetical protein R3200_00005 [Xanthomonadales bacterium]|nr:hypothetical protein [Xanthomonadales bacterium]